MAQSDIWCVVGLGNPGRRYRRTRHNLGFGVAEELARRWNSGRPRRAFSGRVWESRRGPKSVRVLEPMTFMNRSGQAVSELARFYKVQAARLLIVLDDLAMPPGKIRLRGQGSAGGHKGLCDVLDRLGTDQVARLRLGIGEPPAGMDATDYVLGRMSKEELALANEAIDHACQAVEDWLAVGTEAAMNKHN